jgi:hypothetical protein
MYNPFVFFIRELSSKKFDILKIIFIFCILILNSCGWMHVEITDLNENESPQTVEVLPYGGSKNIGISAGAIQSTDGTFIMKAKINTNGISKKKFSSGSIMAELQINNVGN